MEKLLIHWGVKDLVRLLNGIDDKLLPSLQKVLPPLLGRTAHPDCIYNPNDLMKIAAAFLDTDAIANTTFREECLNRLPPAILQSCAEYLGIDAVDFVEQRETIARCAWTGKFAEKFVEFFVLPNHFLPSNAEPCRYPHLKRAGVIEGWTQQLPSAEMVPHHHT